LLLLQAIVRLRRRRENRPIGQVGLPGQAGQMGAGGEYFKRPTVGFACGSPPPYGRQ